MQGTYLLICAAGYFALLLLLSYLTSRRADNDAFFRGNRTSRWWAVAFGMIGASVSGVTFVSVPGMVETSSMAYIQMCLGFVVGYALVAFVLLPLYYRMNLTTIYTYLDYRFGHIPYLTGSVFFFISKLIGASIRLYLACTILQTLIFDHYGI
ncbi:MAG: sodium:solute symporter, partial [Bacteroidaceae bacterium]|nr:sodium:solute symporter [Bacteroidaceae bacterium]